MFAYGVMGELGLLSCPQNGMWGAQRKGCRGGIFFFAEPQAWLWEGALHPAHTSELTMETGSATS